MAEKQKMHQDTVVWLFAFKTVSIVTLFFITAAITDIIHLIHWFKTLYAPQV